MTDTNDMREAFVRLHHEAMMSNIHYRFTLSRDELIALLEAWHSQQAQGEDVEPTGHGWREAAADELQDLFSDRPSDEYPTWESIYRILSKFAPSAPAAVPEGCAEVRRVLQELVDIGHIEDEQSLRDAKAALAAAPAEPPQQARGEAVPKRDLSIDQLIELSSYIKAMNKSDGMGPDELAERVAEWCYSKAWPAPAAVPERNLIQEVAMERERQDEKWGRESDDQKAPFDWCRIIQDYAGWARTMAGMDNPEKYRKRMIQIAAIAVAAIESHDRRMGAAPTPVEPAVGEPGALIPHETVVFDNQHSYEALEAAQRGGCIVQRCSLIVIKDSEPQVHDWHDVDTIDRAWPAERYRAVIRNRDA